jgi:hypothetical protein
MVDGTLSSAQLPLPVTGDFLLTPGGVNED